LFLLVVPFVYASWNIEGKLAAKDMPALLKAVHVEEKMGESVGGGALLFRAVQGRFQEWTEKMLTLQEIGSIVQWSTISIQSKKAQRLIGGSKN
jgi:hypothetical protein